MKKHLLFSIACLLLYSGCGKSDNKPEASTTIFLQNDFALPVQNVLIGYKSGGAMKLYINLGSFDKSSNREVDFDQPGTAEVFIFYDIMRNGILYTEMVVTSFHLVRASKNTISISNLSQVKAVSKTSSEYPGSNPAGGTVRSCGTHNGKQLYKGADGGCYYINSNGNKTYVGRSECNC